MVNMFCISLMVVLSSDKPCMLLYSHWGNTSDSFKFQTQQQMCYWIQPSNIPNVIREIILLTPFVVWRERCLRIFIGIYKMVQDMVHEIKHECILIVD
jgi:hypothetical protein